MVHPQNTLGNNLCNTNALSSQQFSDEGIITNKSLIPIRSALYGPIQFETQMIRITIGPLTCKALPISTEDQVTVPNTNEIVSLWQYGLWSFQAGDTKLERFLPKNQQTQRKSFNFENRNSGGLRS